MSASTSTAFANALNAMGHISKHSLGALSLAIGLAFAATTAAEAGGVVVGCRLVERYSDFQVRAMLGEVKSFVSAGEASAIYSRYVSLKSECQSNAKATRVVAISPSLRGWLTQNGVNVGQ